MATEQTWDLPVVVAESGGANRYDVDGYCEATGMILVRMPMLCDA